MSSTDAFEQDLKDGTLPTEIADWKLLEAAY
jgi:hypothetical protein